MCKIGLKLSQQHQLCQKMSLGATYEYMQFDTIRFGSDLKKMCDYNLFIDTMYRIFGFHVWFGRQFQPREIEDDFGTHGVLSVHVPAGLAEGTRKMARNFRTKTLQLTFDVL